MNHLPSILEYSQETLDQRLSTLAKKKVLAKTIASQSGPLQIHLDFVLKYFAQDRHAMESLGPEVVLEKLKNTFGSLNLEVSIHLMGDTEDLVKAFQFFEKYDFNPKWKYVILVPERSYESWKHMLKVRGLKISQAKAGIWYDLGQWEGLKFMPRVDYLLMTVKAGKSGQKLQGLILHKALVPVKKFPSTRFILDGGWSLSYKPELKNVKIVSYTSFWNEISK